MASRSVRVSVGQVSHRRKDSQEHEYRPRQMRLALVRHANDYGHEGKEQCREEPCTHTAEPPSDCEHHEDADDAPCGCVCSGDDVKLSELFGVVEVVDDVASYVDESEHSAQSDDRPDGVDEQAAVLIESRVEIEPVGVHARERHHRDHFVGLIGVQTVAEVNSGDVFFGGG